MKELRILLFQRALYKLPTRDVLKKEINISFCIITISASNLYMPMIRLYVFLLDFLIPFLCDPDLQCSINHFQFSPKKFSFHFAPDPFNIFLIFEKTFFLNKRLLQNTLDSVFISLLTYNYDKVATITCKKTWRVQFIHNKITLVKYCFNN